MKIQLLAVILLLVTMQIYPQDRASSGIGETSAKGSNWYFGGNVNLSLGTYSYFGISPFAAYRISPQVHAGARLSYAHAWDKTYSITTESNLFGASLFLKYVPVKEFYLMVEPALYSYEVKSSSTKFVNKGVPFIFLGAGFNYYLNPRTFLSFEVKFDVLNDDDSPYKDRWNPFYSAGIGFGI